MNTNVKFDEDSIVININYLGMKKNASITRKRLVDLLIFLMKWIKQDNELYHRLKKEVKYHEES